MGRLLWVQQRNLEYLLPIARNILGFGVVFVFWAEAIHRPTWPNGKNPGWSMGHPYISPSASLLSDSLKG